jgi:hypothetical protein
LKPRYKNIIELVSLLCIYLCIVIIINPRGNFPTNDDWSYSRTVKTFLETGVFQLTGWGSLPLLPQAMWGWLFCKIFGFSFEILRFSTFILSIISLIFIYLTILEYSESRVLRVFSILFIISNPLFTASSLTFMTDIPFFTIGIAAVYFYLRFFHTEKFTYLLPAIILSIVSIFVRQIGLLFLVSFALVFFFNREMSLGKKLIPLFILILSITALILFQSSMHFAGPSPFVANSRMENLKETFTISKLFGIASILKTGGMIFLYLGVFLSPFLVIFSKKLATRNGLNRRTFIYMSLFSACVLALLYSVHKLMPLRPNLIWTYGIGPATLKDADYLLQKNIPFIPDSIWALITLIGIFGGVFVAVLLVKKIKYYIRKAKSDYSVLYSSEVFIVVLIICFTIPLCFGEFYDRYLLLHIPLIMFLLLRRIPEIDFKNERLRIRIASGIIIVFGLFTILSTRDYFAWNRNRWKLLDYAMNELHVKPESIDGGFEFNGWYCYDPLYRKSPDKTWWWVNDDSFLVTFGKMKDYSVIKTEPYYSWLFQKKVTVNLSMKLSSSSGNK